MDERPDNAVGAIKPPDPLAQSEALAGAGARSLAHGVRHDTMPEGLQHPLISSDEDYDALPMGKPFRDPHGNTRVKPWEVKEDSDYDAVPEGAQFIDPEGNTRQKPVYQPVDFTTQTLYDMSTNDRERRNALERAYPGKVQQQSTGEFFVDDDGKLLKPRNLTDPNANWSTAGAKMSAVALPTGGAIAGDIAGAIYGGGVGAIAGGGLGSAAGQGVNDIILGIAGVYDRSIGEEARELGGAGAMGAVGSGVGRAVSSFGATGNLGSEFAAHFLGADADKLAQATALRDKGVLPPISGWAKEAPHLHNVVEVFDPAFHTQKPLLQSATAHYENAGNRVLEGLGAAPAKLTDPATSVATQPTGKALQARALAQASEADARMRVELEAQRAAAQAGLPGQQARLDGLRRTATDTRQAAERLIQQGYWDIQNTADVAAQVSGAGHNGGDLWESIGNQLQSVRRALGERANTMYRQADTLAGDHLPNVEGLPEIARRFADELPEEFQRNQPALVRQLRQMGGIPNPPPGEPGHVADAGEWLQPPSAPTFGQLHNLRSQVRGNVDFYRLNSDIKNGTYKFFAKRVDDALRDTESVPELAPAVEMLNQADKFYRENMPIFEAQQIRTIMRGLEAGEPADPQKLFDAVVKEGHTDLTNRIRTMVGPNLWAGVQAADLTQMLQASRGILPGQTDGAAFVRQVLDRHRSGLLETVHGRDVTERLLSQARGIAMLDGKLPIAVQPGDTMADVVGRARVAAEAAKEAAKRDPLSALNKEMRAIERQHAQKVGQMRAARRDDPLGFLYDPTVGAAEAVQNILGHEDMILASAARFGADSPEFNMLRQVHAQRILQGTLEPSAKLAKISPEVQQLMFPGATLEQMRTLAKDMDFLMSSRGAQDTAKSMAAVSKVEHPWASILGRGDSISKVVTAPLKALPFSDPIGRHILGSYYALVRDITTDPRFLRWVQKGLAGDDKARAMVREAVQKRMQRNGPIGAGAAQGAFQSGGTSPEPPDADSPPAPQRNAAEGSDTQFAAGAPETMSDADPPRVGGSQTPQDDLVPPVSYGEHKQYRSADPVLSQLGIPQASDAEMAQEARDAAAQRQVRTNTPKFGPDRPDISDLLGRLIIPGYALGEDLYQGEYGDAAIDAVFAAAPYARGIASAIPSSVKSAATKAVAGAAGLGGLFGATGGPSGAADQADFSFIDDPAERKIAQSNWEQIKKYGPDKKLDVIATRNARQEYVKEISDDFRKRSKERGEKEAEAERTAKAAGKEREAAETAYREFEDANRETIGKFTPEQQAQWNALAGADAKQTRKNRQEFLVNESNKAAAQAETRKLAERAFAQKYPEAANALRVAGVVLGIGMPLMTSVTRAGALKTHAKAIDKAITDVAKTAQTEGRALTVPERQSIEPLLALKAGKIEEAAKLHSFAKRDLILAPMMPIAANDWLPNMFDAATLGDNPDNPNYKKALAAIDPRDPAAFVDAAVPYLPEAIIDVGLGLGGGHTIRDFSGAKASAKGSLKGAEGFIKDTRALEQTEKTTATSELMKRTQEAESKLKALDDKRAATNAKTAETRRQKVEAAKKAEEDAKKAAEAVKKRPVGRTKQQLKGQSSP